MVAGPPSKKSHMLRLYLSYLSFAILLVSTPCVAQTAQNPYASGCLRSKLDSWDNLRVCNSNDAPKAAATGLCKAPDFDYLEIRISSGNWFSATALGWLVQIILSEVLRVPSTFEGGGHGLSRDFYDHEGRVDLDQPGTAAMLSVANAQPDSDCRPLVKSKERYEACAHFSPEGKCTLPCRRRRSVSVATHFAYFVAFIESFPQNSMGLVSSKSKQQISCYHQYAYIKPHLLPQSRKRNHERRN